MFRGATKITIDDKGRVVVPVRHRGLLSAAGEGRVIVTVDRDECLLIYAAPEWERIEQQLNSLPSLHPQVRRLQRLMVGHAEELLLDSHGRLALTPELREFDDKIADVRRRKESAIDSQDFELAASLRDEEKKLIVKDLSLTNTQSALINSVLSLMWALGAYVIARWSDSRGSRKPFLLAFLLIFSACSIISGLAQSFPVLLLSRAIMGAVEGPFLPVCLAIMAVESSRNRRGVNAGIMQNFFAALLGQSLAPWLLPFRILYVVFAIFTWLAYPIFNLMLFVHPVGRHALDREQRATRMIMQVHDELVFEVPQAEIDWVRAEVPRLMAGVAALKVPLLAEIGVGPNWDKAH